ncbi:hypothetical protein K2V74_14110 [Mammaliicoccus sciuri]|uniref:hypothetical protein n=1 Tax=Mammaliicoccus sciuri TaxID=1296 RepID=UPI001E5B911B|nr:hypothetical protein [Mammaliicoccus sciuri]MCD8875453.1 hypothetical protein [Mammaliicoccus sciuri]
MSEKRLTNLDKFYKIEDMMGKAESEVDSYIEKLKDRNEYINEYRREFMSLKSNVGRIKRELDMSKEAFTEDQHILFKSGLVKLGKEIKRLEEERQYDTDNNYSSAIKKLSNAYDDLAENPNIDTIESYIGVLSNQGVNIEEFTFLVSKTKGDNSASHIVKMLSEAENEYLKSFKEYRESCEAGEDVLNAFDRVADLLYDEGYVQEYQDLEEVLPDIDRERGERPDPQSLLDIFVPIKSSNLEYWQSNYRNSRGHELNLNFAKAIAYMRRALLEGREYRGTQNAYDRLKAAYDELSGYMYERYHELGGTPNNYHGHEDRKR